jgi:hypothetical protein
MTDIRIIPGSGLINITGSAKFTGDSSNTALFITSSTSNVGVGFDLPEATLHVSGTSDVFIVEGSGSTVVDVQGSQGQLFSVTDSLSGSLMSVNDISGIPILEVFSDNKVVMGTFGANTLVVTGSSVGIGTNTPGSKLSIDDGNIEFRTSNPATIKNRIVFSESAWGDTSFYIEHDGAGSGAANILKIFGDGSGGTAGGITVNRVGNVGIGITAPTQKLDVRGIITSYAASGNFSRMDNGSFQATGDHGGTFMLDLDNTGAADLVNIKKSGTSRFYIKNDGNVGIGTTNPVSLLHIYSTNVAPQGITVRGGDETFIKFLTTGVKNWGLITTNLAASDFGIYQSTSAGGDPFSAGTARMYFNADGNVGIGTTNPANTLDVLGKVSINSDGTVNWGNARDYGRLTWDIDKAIVRGQSGKALSLGANGTQDYLWIATSSNVGIGTTNPLSKLHVNGPIRASLSNVNQANFVAYNSSTGLFTYASTSSIVIGTATNADNVYINEDASDAPYPVLFAEFVNEYQPVRGNNDFNYNPSTGTLTAGTYVESSALKFKENVIHLTGSLQDVEKLQGVSYNKIGQTRKEIGLIADEVVKVLPELVKYQDGEVYGLSYNRLTAVLVEAVKELNDKVKQQEIFIQDLADRLKKLEDKG